MVWRKMTWRKRRKRDDEGGEQSHVGGGWLYGRSIPGGGRGDGRAPLQGPVGKQGWWVRVAGSARWEEAQSPGSRGGVRSGQMGLPHRPPSPLSRRPANICYPRVLSAQASLAPWVTDHTAEIPGSWYWSVALFSALQQVGRPTYCWGLV